LILTRFHFYYFELRVSKLREMFYSYSKTGFVASNAIPLDDAKIKMKVKCCLCTLQAKRKAVSQHIYGGAGGRGGIAPTHSRPRH
jgi:hypothetical protein